MDSMGGLRTAVLAAPLTRRSECCPTLGTFRRHGVLPSFGVLWGGALFFLCSSICMPMLQMCAEASKGIPLTNTQEVTSRKQSSRNLWCTTIFRKKPIQEERIPREFTSSWDGGHGVPDLAVGNPGALLLLRDMCRGLHRRVPSRLGSLLSHLLSSCFIRF